MAKLTLLLFLFVLNLNGAEPKQVLESVKQDEIKARVYQSITKKEEEGFERLSPPRLNEWLAKVKEAAETFEDYQASTPTRPTSQRQTIVIQPLGAMNENQKRLLEAMCEYAAVFFQLPARIAPEIPLPAYDGKNKIARIFKRDRFGPTQFRYDADKLMDEFLVPALPEDAAIFIGVTMFDLISGNQAVFGQASTRRRVGLYCFIDPRPSGTDEAIPGVDALTLRRACKLLNHESGHMLGLAHCVFYKCSMNGCNGMTEADNTPLHYCPVCQKKLLFNIGADARKRNEALLAFYLKYKMTADAEWTAERLKK